MIPSLSILAIPRHVGHLVSAVIETATLFAPVYPIILVLRLPVARNVLLALIVLLIKHAETGNVSIPA